jgi:hypothetical protein
MKSAGALEPPPADREMSPQQEREWWETYVENRAAKERTIGILAGLLAGATLVGAYRIGWLIFGPVFSFWVVAWYLGFRANKNSPSMILAWILMVPVAVFLVLFAFGKSFAGL